MSKIGDVIYSHMFIGEGEPERFGSVTMAAYCVGHGRWSVGVAFCSPRDQFSRKVGRAIAVGRAQIGSDPGFEFDADPAATIKEIAHALRGEFITWLKVAGSALPQWVREAHAGAGPYLAPRDPSRLHETVFVPFSH